MSAKRRNNVQNQPLIGGRKNQFRATHRVRLQDTATSHPQIIRVPLPVNKSRRRSRSIPLGCAMLIIMSCMLVCLTAAYMAYPHRINLLLLGIDYTEPGSAVGRSDTIILTTFIPTTLYVGMLSIPRDLWVSIPNIGENRINTAHFFAEIQQAGSGPFFTQQTVKLNFGVDLPYYMRIRFDGFREVVNAMGGVDLELSKPMGGYSAGKHHLTGNKALAFVRDRQGSDDFYRMEQSHVMLKAVFLTMIKPNNWSHLPTVIRSLNNAIDTNVPFWIWPKLVISLVLAGMDNIDSRYISRDMVTPFFTSEGANVLAPNWSKINLLIEDMFGK